MLAAAIEEKEEIQESFRSIRDVYQKIQKEIFDRAREAFGEMKQSRESYSSEEKIFGE